MLLGSAPTLERVKEVIAAFYGGEQKELRPLNDASWSVHKADGSRLSTVVRLKKGRYRFESP